MAYIFREKISLNFKQLAKLRRPVVLVVESESSLAGLYAKHLSEHDFEVAVCPDLRLVPEKITALQPAVCLINPQGERGLGNSLKLLKSLRDSFPHLSLVTVAFNLSNQEVKDLMEAGVVSHVDRRLTRPQDLVEIVNILTSGYNFSNN